ncbi:MULTISPECIES: site-specific integrase [Bacillus subtilis group]|jgi:integrase|uniref:site-specific integrase n=1 Tax=Bacillus subtilis group TaxID=653685 RepID=UPI0007794740|nr:MULTISPECIES: site-specific integrase [Bacillus subtilis group]MBW7636318.1 site-specific integrase [Bacillus licheniformis]MCY8151989.1 site-specific integrase [Bacillus paralicheniformis]MEC1050924.1 site-specific integrase [Bacillus paralicheniformis]MEC1085044.1 site-specific integrase [Bacillus paralicheniformis]MEC1108844.1 site-specific integrase [Bacillus paralicheniformis]
MDEKNVQPLRTIDEINDMKWALRRFGKERDRFLFVFGINTGLRASDIVSRKVGDVRGKQHVIIREKKTGKIKRFYLNKALQDEINEYTYGMEDDDFLFPSRKGNSHITTTQAYRLLTKAASMLGRNDVGTHTMRKTFGYHHYKRHKDVATLQTLFNHSAPSITLKYIGITDDEVQATLEDFSL